MDAASGGFVAPFQRYRREEQGDWDFALPSVLSISASGHKFGQSCCGTGWVVWRSHTDLAEHVAVSVGYLGGKADSLTLNFSRPATGVYVQYYKILRLGFEGFARLTDNMMAVATFIRRGLLAMKRPKDGAQYFQSLDALEAKGCCLPVVSARLNPDLADQIPFDDIDLQHAIAQYKWYVGAKKQGCCFNQPCSSQVRLRLQALIRGPSHQGAQAPLQRRVARLDHVQNRRQGQPLNAHGHPPPQVHRSEHDF